MYPAFLPISGHIVVYLCLHLADHVQYIVAREVPVILVLIVNFLGEPIIDGVKCALDAIHVVRVRLPKL
jgi:hypothetical protein